jgi:hypothetical protein
VTLNGLEHRTRKSTPLSGSIRCSPFWKQRIVRRGKRGPLFRTMALVWLSGKLQGIVRNHHAGKLARGPDMDRVREVERFIQRSPFDADLVRSVLVSVLHAGPASGAKETGERPSAVGRPHPALGFSLHQSNVCAPDPDRDAESRCRLLPTLATMAHVGHTWCAHDFVAHIAALAAARQYVSTR